MPIIKDQQITENTWTFVADETPLIYGDITVSLSRWNDDQQQLLKHSGKLGLRLTTSDDISTLTQKDLSKFSLIELTFEAFTDGRSFSQARLLRSQYGYQGEIRAVGNFMADQVFYLHRVGVTSFEITDKKQIEVALAAFRDFSFQYQKSTE